MNGKTVFNGARSATLLSLAVAAVVSSGVASAATAVFNANSVGVSPDPANIQGGANEIYDGLGGGTQALLVDFGSDVFDVRMTPLSLGTDGGGCVEVGRWTAFDETGSSLGTGTFTTNNTVTITSEPLRYVAFSADPYLNGCSYTGGQPDTSDFKVGEVSWGATDDTEARVSRAGTALRDELGVDSFLAYDLVEAFQDGSGNLIDPNGDRIGQVVIIIDPEGCEGGAQGPGSGEECEIDYGNGELTSFIADAADIQGTLTVADIIDVDDPRACTDASSGAALVLDGSSGLPNLPTDGAGGVLTIPPHLCGIPDDETGNPQFTVVVLQSEVEISRSVVLHKVDSPETAPGEVFECKDPASLGDDAARSTQPVLGWLPRFDAEFPEIPVTNAGGTVVSVLEDVTTGPCGSYRGSTGRWSYIVYDLRHLPNTDYASIVVGDIEQVSATLRQVQQCGSPKSQTLNDDIVQMRNAVKDIGKGKFASAKARVERLERDLGSAKSPLSTSLADCYYNLSNPGLIYSDSELQFPEVPRNFRGDLESQVGHVLYMFESFLGVN